MTCTFIEKNQQNWNRLFCHLLSQRKAEYLLGSKTYFNYALKKKIENLRNSWKSHF